MPKDRQSNDPDNKRYATLADMKAAGWDVMATVEILKALDSPYFDPATGKMVRDIPPETRSQTEGGADLKGQEEGAD